MVRQRAKAIKKVEDTSWVSRDLELIRDVASLGAKITIKSFTAIHIALNDEESEQRLRKLTQLGWLHMSAAVDTDGKFVEFVWELR